MKKVLALLLAAAMMLSLFGCGAAKEEAPAQAPAAEAPKAEAPAAEAPAAAPAEVKWPQGAIQLVCAYAAGGGTDLTARTMADAMSEFGNFGVVNNTDGGGVVGWEQVRTSDPEICDQLIFALNSMFVTYLSGVSDINPMTDIEPVFAMDGNAAYFVVVNKDAPYNSIDELIAYSKEHPGEVTLGAGAPGSSMSIMTSQFIQSTGVDCKLVATSGSDADAVAMVMGGNMSMYLTNQSTTQNYLEAGEIKVLASIHPLGKSASDIVKDIPTLEDLGYKNSTMGTQFIVWAPVGADPAVYEKINACLNAALADEAVYNSILERGFDCVSFGNYQETKDKLQACYDDCATAWDAYMAAMG